MTGNIGSLGPIETISHVLGSDSKSREGIAITSGWEVLELTRACVQN